MVDVIHVHEDDWGMRNLYPIAVRAAVERDIADAADAGERNRDPSGFGWTDMYVTQPPEQGYADVGLTLAAAEAVLTPILPRVRNFNATVFSAMGRSTPDPYGAYEDEAWCFGLGPHCYVKLDEQDDLVGGVWFDINTDDPDAIDRLRRAILAIDALVPSMIADYFLKFSGAVSEEGSIERYFTLLAEQRAYAEQAMLEYRAIHQDADRAPGMHRKLLSTFGLRS